MSEPIINDDNFESFISPTVDGAEVRRGLVPRDYLQYPVGWRAGLHAVSFPLIPRSEWSARIAEKTATRSRLSDLWNAGDNGRPIEVLDQNGQGYCWAYSVGAAIMAVRAAAGMPYVRVSPHAVACKIKNFRDEGGWGALAVEFAIENGYPAESFWPQKSMRRQYDNADTWNNARAQRIAEGWWDLAEAVYDRNLTFDQVATLLLSNVPVVLDYNWWGHSVCGLDLVEVERGSFGLRIANSWSPRWGENGFGVLQGNRAIPDGATAPRWVVAA